MAGPQNHKTTLPGSQVFKGALQLADSTLPRVHALASAFAPETTSPDPDTNSNYTPALVHLVATNARSSTFPVPTAIMSNQPGKHPQAPTRLCAR